MKTCWNTDFLNFTFIDSGVARPSSTVCPKTTPSEQFGVNYCIPCSSRSPSAWLLRVVRRTVLLILPICSTPVWSLSDSLLPAQCRHWLGCCSHCKQLETTHTVAAENKTGMLSSPLTELCYRLVQTLSRGPPSWQIKPWSPLSSTSTRNSPTLTSEETS